jgi:Inhibitor of sigma-G Gin
MDSPLMGETCVICECKKSVGIHLYTSFICDGCETDILHTDTDNPKYRFFLEQLKKHIFLI